MPSKFLVFQKRGAPWAVKQDVASYTTTTAPARRSVRDIKRLKSYPGHDLALRHCLQTMEERVVARMAAEMARLFQSQQAVSIDAVQAEDEASIQDALPQRPEPDARLWQNQQNAAARAQFIEQCGGLLSSKEVADVLASKAKNRAATANHLKDKGKILCVRLHGQDCFPGFQFDSLTQHCHPEMAEVIKALARDHEPGWQMALWFITGNDWLDGNMPLDLWGTQRRAVVDAALAESTAFDA
jgi:hypothetical protein